MDTRRKTINDVARMAGVSYQTVSRVINNHPSVSDGTRQRVMEAIEKLDYRPNRAAQSLAGRHTRTLGITVFGLDYYGPAQVIVSIENVARTAGYDLILGNAKNETLEEMRAAIRHLRHWELDGFLLIAPLEGVNYDELQTVCNDKPIVMIGGTANIVSASVAVDQRLGARLGAEHLLSLGHRRIAEVRGPEDWIDAQGRHRGLVETLAQAGQTLSAVEVGDWTSRGGYHAALRLLDSHAHFTAIVVANDQMALGVLRALSERGISVPDQVSVLGFDDIPESAYFNPPLTTIRQDFDQLGRMAVDHLLDQVKRPHLRGERRLIAPILIPRASTAPPPSEGIIAT